MIQNRFRNIVEELKGQIKNVFWSGPSCDADACGGSVLLAVSGGMDSMCMADLFYETFGADAMAIAHCNFNLRGEESDADEAMVKAWAQERNIRLHTVSFDTEEYASSNGISIEMAARELRYAWFAGLCKKCGYQAVAVAHHAEDNAETLLLNLVRGTGLKGIAGMKAVSPMPCSGGPVPVALMRPLLSFTRKQIEGYVLQAKVPYRTDSTNASVEYRRNRVRHEVFPVLSKLNPSFVGTLNREMTYFSDAGQIVEDWCSVHSEKVIIQGEKDQLKISLKELMKVSQWRYLLYYILEPYGFSHSVLASVEDLLVSGRTASGKMFCCGEWILHTGRGEMSLRRKDDFVEPENSVVVEGDGSYALGDTRFTVEVFARPDDMILRQPEGVQILDADKLGLPFLCRRWMQGDWMVPLGMRGRKKVSDIFNDLKYDSFAKSSAIIVEPCRQSSDAHRIAALMGVRVDGRFKIDDNTRTIIRISKL